MSRLPNATTTRSTCDKMPLHVYRMPSRFCSLQNAQLIYDRRGRLSAFLGPESTHGRHDGHRGVEPGEGFPARTGWRREGPSWLGYRRPHRPEDSDGDMAVVLRSRPARRAADRPTPGPDVHGLGPGRLG